MCTEREFAQGGSGVGEVFLIKLGVQYKCCTKIQAITEYISIGGMSIINVFIVIIERNFLVVNYFSTNASSMALWVVDLELEWSAMLSWVAVVVAF